MVFQMGCFPLVFHQVLRISNTNNNTKLFFLLWSFLLKNQNKYDWTVLQWSMSVWWWKESSSKMRWSLCDLFRFGLIMVWGSLEWCPRALQQNKWCHWPCGPHVHFRIWCWSWWIWVCYTAAVLPRSHDPRVQFWVRGKYKIRGKACYSFAIAL